MAPLVAVVIAVCMFRFSAFCIRYLKSNFMLRSWLTLLRVRWLVLVAFFLFFDFDFLPSLLWMLLAPKRLRYFIFHAHSDVVGEVFGQCDTGHGQVECACLVVLNLSSDVIIESHAHSQERREGLVDADSGNIVHGRRNGVARGDVADEAPSVHVFHKVGIGVVCSDRVNTLVGMVDVETLEMVGKPRRNLGESTVGETPVGHESSDGWENVEWGGEGIASTVCGKEGWHHHIG